jgi:hypothetical protein
LARLAFALLTVLILGCGSTLPATLPPPRRVDCGPLDPVDCDAAAAAVLSAVVDPPSAPVAVEIEDGSFCADHLFDGAPCPPRQLPPGASWIGRAEVIFGNSYVSAFFDVSAGPDGVDAALVATASRPQPSPTD